MGIDKPRTRLERLEATPSRLDPDAKNLFVGAYTRLQNVNISGRFEKLKSLETYEEYLRGYLPPEEAEEIIRSSNPDNIRRVNELVTEYNNALSRIKQEKNTQIGIEILDRMNKVFLGEE